jgi:hypothetical protein
MLSSGDEQAREIEKFCEIARENGASLSVRELAQLAPSVGGESELEDAFRSDPRLRSRFQLVSGYVLQRPPDEGEARVMVEDEEKNRERARLNIAIAARFAARLVPGTLLVCLSGSNSYRSAREGDDIDFFCVTKKNRMWTFMLRSLVLTRIFSLGKDRARVCLSCIMDEEWARSEFDTKQDPIFARDALMASPIYGAAAYHNLLTRASWIDGYFPAFYKARLRETAAAAAAAGREGAGLAVVNSFLFAVLGSYMRLKGWALNRKYRRQGRERSLFTLKMGPGHYLCESNKYKKLRQMYLGEPTV